MTKLINFIFLSSLNYIAIALLNINMAQPPSYNEAIDEKKLFDPNSQPYPSAPYPQASAPYMPVPSNQPYPQANQPYPPANQPYAPPNQPYPPANQPYPSANYQTEYAPHPAEAAVHQPSYQSSPHDEENGFTVRGTFDDKSVRRLFIRKVYITLGLQLLVTFGIVCIFTFIPSVKEFVRRNSAMYYVAYAIFLALYIALVCCSNIRRKHPTNIILLGVFTLALSYMVGTIASFYDTMSVVIALGITVGVCIAVTLFSLQTKFDFTKCSGLLFVLVLVLMLFGFITIFTWSRPWYLHVVYGSLGALVFTLFLAFDTQLIMGGKRYELDPEEYIYGALNLYIDVVYIFIFILSIFGSSN